MKTSRSLQANLWPGAFAVMLCLAGCRSLDRRPQEKELPGIYYRVKAGDNLAAIAKAYRVSVDEIMDINGIENTRALRVGQDLFLPDPDPIGTKVVKLARKAPAAPKDKGSKASTAVPSAHKILAFPVRGGKIFRNFSRSKTDPYDGIGISAQAGTPVLASLQGKVLFVGNDGTKFGLLVILEHERPFITVYTHLDQALVKEGQHVAQGATIGTVGSSGGVSSPRLHFQVRVDQRPQNPVNYFKSAPAQAPSL